MPSKLCCYCHNKPRRPKSPYCSDKCEAAKHRVNTSDPEKRRRQVNASRAKRRAQDKLEHEQELQRQREMLEQARMMLNEPDVPPHRLRPMQEVSTWNVITGKIEMVKL